MPYLADRVKDSSTTTGTGNFTLSGTAPTGYQSFNNAFGLNTVFAYTIVDSASGLWESGTGYLSTSTNLVRGNVFSGSSGDGVAVTFTAGTKDVFCSAPAELLMDSNSGAILAKVNGMAMP